MLILILLGVKFVAIYALFLWVKFGLGDLLRVKDLTFRNSVFIIMIMIIIKIMNNITLYVILNATREAVVEVESFPKPDFPDMMSKMEMSDLADFELDFEPNKYQAKVH